MSQQLQPSPYARWLDEYALHDECMGAAYKSLSGQSRAVLKKCIARLYRLWGECSGRERLLRHFADDFCLEQEEFPASCALFVCDAAYRHPAALLAAIMPALLAGVKEILPCFVSSSQNAPSPDWRLPHAFLLAALELAGVEQAFHTSLPALEEFLRMFSAKHSNGRLVLLGDAPFGEDLLLRAHSENLRCRSLVHPPLYYNARLALVVEQNFGEQPCKSMQTNPASGAQCERDGESGIFLHLDEAHEDIWVWPDLDPVWFRSRRMRLFSS